MKTTFLFLQKKLPFLVIGLMFGWSVFVIARRESTSPKDDRIVIRIGHWQLEPGVRDGFAEAAIEYQKLHPDVKVMQEAIPESTYPQWLSTQLMGGTAPDIVEIGKLPPNQLLAFNARYLLPLTPYISQPNPYNKGTDLEGVPLILTFKDNLRRAYVNELQEYMNIPLGLGSIRLFYNQTLLKQLTGSEIAPTDFREFLAVCEKIAVQKHTNDRNYIAIAGSQYHFGGWQLNLVEPLTFGALREIDINRDGLFGFDEMFLGFHGGKVDFSHPAYAASFKMVHEITRFFPSGWTGLNRDESLFNFAQQKAVFISAGLWEAEGIWLQAEGRFKVGVMDFPAPTASDPVYGPMVMGQRYENPEGGMPMAITRTSRNPDVALDFLLFLASRKQNAAFNRRLKWIPIIEGAEIAPGIEIFAPRLEGVYSAFNPNLGAETTIKWGQLYSLYQIKHITYEDMAREFTDFYITDGLNDYKEFNRNVRRGELRSAQFAILMRQRALAGNDDNRSPWVKYRAAAVAPLNTELGCLMRTRYIEDPDTLKSQSYYRYTPYALKNLQATLKEGQR